MHARESADAAVAYFREFHPQRPTLINVSRLAARARIFAFEYMGAEASARQAVELSRNQKAASAAWLVGTLADLGEVQWLQLKIEDAERSYRESVATSLKANGEDHPETLTSKIKLASLLLQTGRRDEGEALVKEVQARLDRPDSKISPGRIASIQGILASTRFDLGRPGEAEQATAADVDDLRATFPNSGTLASRHRRLAEIKIALGRYDEAERQLQLGEEVWRRFAGADRPAAGDQWFALTRARLLNARGDAVAALRELETIPAPSTSAANVQSIAIFADIERAQAAVQAGDARLGVVAGQRAVEALSHLAAGRLPVIEARALTAVGRAHAAQGNTGAARAALLRAVELHAAAGDPLGLWSAETKSELARVLAASDPPRSRSLLSAAAEIRRAHSAGRDGGRR